MSKNSRRKRRRAAQRGVGNVNPKYLVPTRLDLWQQRLADSDNYWDPERQKMDHREALYNGDDELRPLVPGDSKADGSHKRTSHVRNIIFENIESQISSSIPQPKVTARRQKDERLADLIEHFIRNELDRQPFETMNDMAERTVPMQGGVGFLVEWDNTKRTHTTVGEADVSTVHPKQFAPQPGIYTGIADMDWFIVKVPTTKEAVRRRYGVAIYNEPEAEPEIRSSGGEHTTEDAVTMYVGFELGEQGGINKYVWVNDVELEDLENYQARRQPVCSKCGRVRPLPGQVIYNNVQTIGTQVAGQISPDQLERDMAGHQLAHQMAAQAMLGEDAMPGIGVDPGAAPEQKYDGGPCPWCGSEDFEDQEQEYEQVMLPIKTAGGVNIPGAEAGFDKAGNPVLKPTLIPFYKPDVYPIVLQRSVSVYGQLLGSSDVDAIEDQQNTINRMEQKIIDRLIKAGTRITLPDRADLRIDPEDSEKWYIGNVADRNMIGVYDFSGDLQYELAYLAQVYEEARQILGITDSFQGRRDPTATSGVAKEYSAAQAAGRLESKRVMKNAAYAQLFELMFKFWLAYSDEPRPVSYKDFKGETQYEEFNRYDFLEQDADGQWYWNDQFLFSCDTSAPLASNREAMWQETRLNLQTGAFGDPTQTDTLILFWSKMEELHYPGAGTTKKYLEDKLQREQAQAQQMQMMQMQLQAQQAQAQAMPGMAPAGSGVAAPGANPQVSPAVGG